MAGYNKLNRPADQRKAILRNQVTTLLWNGSIRTTQARAKEVRKIAEKLITLAISEYEGTTVVNKEKNNEKGQTVTIEVRKDTAQKLQVRRQLMAYLYDLSEARQEKESKGDYKERTKDIKYPVVEKLFNELAPKYAKRAEEKGTGGGYTRMLKLGPRRGDASEMVILELV
jgi:large subunit ribosomal protein L17